MNYQYLEPIEQYKNSLNSLSPYIGKMRPSLARYLILKYATPNSLIYDPFAGSGTILLEGWVLGHSVIGNDLNYYAYILSLGKLSPFATLEEAKLALQKYKLLVEKKAVHYSIDNIPDWVKSFYDAKTLKEICCWVYYLKRNKEWFLLSCLLGILHHQRPGFLSYPASHGAPYLRSSKYPKEQYPEMYDYKNVYDRMYSKIERSYRDIPDLDFSILRKIKFGDATKIRLKNEHNTTSTIITSPPYMRSLTYARDNRLRLWFLGVQDWISLDKQISPEKDTFVDLMKKCFKKWAAFQSSGDKCVIVIGDISIKYENRKESLSDVLTSISKKHYKCIETFQDPIPEKRKMVKGDTNIKREIVIVLERI